MFSLGSDPELLLVDQEGLPYSSVGLIKGSKDQPRKTRHGWILEDNVMAEFNTKPSKTSAEFIKNHRAVMGDLLKVVQKKGLSLAIEATAVFKEEQLRCPQAREFGCEPDFNAWTLAQNARPRPPEEGLRSCGGHVHISFDCSEPYSRTSLVRILDLLLGVPSVLLDSNEKRRLLYGKAGAHRPKYIEQGHPYDGVEYRVLSNFWLKDDSLMAWVFNTTKQAVDDFEQWIDIANYEEDNIIIAIDDSDKKTALWLCDKYNLKIG